MLTYSTVYIYVNIQYGIYITQARPRAGGCCCLWAHMQASRALAAHASGKRSCCMAAAPILAILGPLYSSDGSPARQNGGTLIERMQQMASVEHTVEVRHGSRAGSDAARPDPRQPSPKLPS